MSKIIVLLFVGILITTILNAQTKITVPEPGKKYPNPGILLVEKENGIESVSLSRHKGIPLIVEFFSSLCSVCFRTMPKLNELQEQFNGKMRFLLIGKEDKNIRRTYETFKQKFQLKLDVAYDSILHKDMIDFPYPLYVWIDANGIVQALTGPRDIDAENIQRLINSEKIVVTPEIERKGFNPRSPYLINGNGGDDTTFLSRSLFTIHKLGDPTFLPPILHTEKLRDSLQLLSARLQDLYLYAYFNVLSWDFSSPMYGNVFPFPVFEDGTYLTVNRFPGAYNYSLWLSKDQLRFTSVMEKFRSDLESQFGYVASIEYKLMPYHRLTVRKGFEEKLRSKGDSVFVATHGSLQLGKGRIRQLVSILKGRLYYEPPFIDETGIDYPIDINLDTIMSDFTMVKEALYECGIEIKSGLKPMTVLVLRQKSRNVAVR